MLDAPVTSLTTPERLAVLESLNVTLQADVTEIKHDVREIARAQASMATELATKTAAIAADLAVKQSADSALGGARASTGIWVRAVVPWFIAGAGAVVGFLALIGGGFHS